MGAKKTLIAIIILAAVLRFYKLGSFPVSLSWDEVAIGYNAYSISQTGADEYGSKFPTLFKSFNDYKLPGYIYLDALFVKVFGLSEFSTRAPSAFFGVLAVIFIYLLVSEFFKTSQPFPQLLPPQVIAALSAFLMAVSPWHLQLSRAAFEANLALTMVLLGLTLLFIGQRNKIAAFFSIPTLSLSIYFYYSPRLFVPLILLAYFILYRKTLEKNLKAYILGLLLSVPILVPIGSQIFSREGLKRVNEVSIFSDRSLIVDYVTTRAKNNSLLAPIFLNRRVPLIFESLHNYFSHFSFGFLFFGDDPNPRHRSSFHGNFYIFEIPTLLIGLWLIIKMKDRRLKSLLIAWLLISPLPAAFTKETPHSLRAILMLPPAVIASAMGLDFLLKKNSYRLILPITAIIFFINYLHSYYLVYPARDNLAWAYGYKQLFETFSKYESNYDRIIVTGHYWKPYIFYLFYNRINPHFYYLNWNQESIAKYRFGTTYWDNGGKDISEDEIEKFKGQNTLVALTPGEVNTPKNKNKFSKLFAIKDYSQKQEIFWIGEWQ